MIDAGLMIFVFEALGFSSSDEAARLVVEVELEPALDDADLVRDDFLRVPVVPALEAEEGRFAVFLAIVGPVYQIRDSNTNHDA